MSKRGAIVTGAASGIGLVLTRDLLSKGWRVIMADINPAGEAIAQDLGHEAIFIKTDISDWTSQTELFEKAFNWHSNISFLAANAGTLTNPNAPDIMSIDSSAPLQKPLLAPINVNLLGSIYSVNLFLYHLGKNKSTPAPTFGSTVRARIVITASFAGLYSLMLDPIYCASKHGLVGLTRSLAPTTLAAHNTTINAICPGCVDTNMTAQVAAATPPEYVIPMSTILEAYSQLLTSDVTGQTVEASGKELFYQKQPDYPNRAAEWLMVDGPLMWQEALANGISAKVE